MRYFSYNDVDWGEECYYRYNEDSPRQTYVERYDCDEPENGWFKVSWTIKFLHICIEDDKKEAIENAEWEGDNPESYRCFKELTEEEYFLEMI